MALSKTKQAQFQKLCNLMAGWKRNQAKELFSAYMKLSVDVDAAKYVSIQVYCESNQIDERRFQASIDTVEDYTKEGTLFGGRCSLFHRLSRENLALLEELCGAIATLHAFTDDTLKGAADCKAIHRRRLDRCIIKYAYKNYTAFLKKLGRSVQPFRLPAVIKHLSEPRRIIDTALPSYRESGLWIAEAMVVVGLASTLDETLRNDAEHGWTAVEFDLDKHLKLEEEAEARRKAYDDKVQALVHRMARPRLRKPLDRLMLDAG